MRRNTPGNETTSRLIGRGGVAVPDPFHACAARLGDVHARRIDRDAMLLADEFALLTDKELSKGAVSLRAAFAWLDDELIENTRSWDAALTAVRAKYAMAEEGLIVLETLVRQSPGSRDLLKRWEEQQVLVDRLEIAVIGLSEQRNLDGGRSVDTELTRSRRRGAAKAVAVAREQAIRAAERERGAPTRAAESPGPAANVREVGTGAVTRARAERRDREHARRHARVVTRGDVAAPRALDQLRPLIGESRALELERLMRPLADWVAQEDDAWVRRRHAELGNASRKLDRGAARRARVTEMRHETEQEERVQAWAEAERFLESHPELADAVVGWADDETSPRASRTYLDAWMDQNLDRVVKALVYQDEFEIRRHMEVMRKVEGSVVDPPEQLRSLIGDGRKLGKPERNRWEALARELERERLLHESAAREGLKHKGPKAKERRELEARVERFRAEVGLEPRAREARVEAASVGMG